MSLLSSITTGRRALPPRVLLYGTDKVGKNTWAAGAPKPIAIQAEEGSDEIGLARFPLCTSFQQIIDQIGTLANDEHDYQTVIIDTLDWAERLIWQAVVDEDPKKVKSIELVGGGYGKGYIQALDKWRLMLDGLSFLRKQKSMVVVMICHHEIKSVNLPDVDPFDRYQPKLQKAAMGMMKEWADAILFAGYRVFAKSVETGRDKTVTKGVGTGERIIQCTERPTHLAGNRYDLPDSLPMPKVGGFALFAEHVAKFYEKPAAVSAAGT